MCLSFLFYILYTCSYMGKHPLPIKVWKTKFRGEFFVIYYRENLQNEYKSHRQDD